MTYPYDSERTGCIKANSEHNTSTPDTSLARANNETSSLYRQPKTRRPQNIITDEEMPESKHQAADGLLVAETRKNLEQLKDENTFFDPLLTPQQPFLLSSGVNQQSGMRCRRNARQETISLRNSSSVLSWQFTQGCTTSATSTEQQQLRL